MWRKLSARRRLYTAFSNRMSRTDGILSQAQSLQVVRCYYLPFLDCPRCDGEQEQGERYMEVSRTSGT